MSISVTQTTEISANFAGLVSDPNNIDNPRHEVRVLVVRDSRVEVESWHFDLAAAVLTNEAGALATTATGEEMAALLAAKTVINGMIQRAATAAAAETPPRNVFRS